MNTSSPPQTGGAAPPAAAPLTCSTKSGAPYRRRDAVEMQISAALALDPQHWRDPDRRPGPWRLETLVYLIRLRATAGDGHSVGALVAEFLAQAKRTMDRRAQGYGLADSEAIEIEVGDALVDLILAPVPTRMSEYLEVDARTMIAQRTDRVVLARRDLPKAHRFLTTEADDDGGWSPTVERLPDTALDPLEHLLEAEAPSSDTRVRRLLRAVTDPRHRKAFILKKLRGWPYDSPDSTVPTLCAHFAPVGERQIRKWIATAIAQMRAAHGADT